MGRMWMSVTSAVRGSCNDETTACAQGHFVHVYVDRESREAAGIPEAQVLGHLVERLAGGVVPGGGQEFIAPFLGEEIDRRVAA